MRRESFIFKRLEKRSRKKYFMLKDWPLPLGVPPRHLHTFTLVWHFMLSGTSDATTFCDFPSQMYLSSTNTLAPFSQLTCNFFQECHRLQAGPGPTWPPPGVPPPPPPSSWSDQTSGQDQIGICFVFFHPHYWWLEVWKLVPPNFIEPVQYLPGWPDPNIYPLVTHLPYRFNIPPFQGGEEDWVW